MKRIWVFSDFYVPRTDAKLEKWLQWYVELGCTDVVLGVNEDPPAKWQLRPPYKLQDFSRAAKALSNAGITPHIMSWIHDQDPAYVVDMMEGLAPLWEDVGDEDMSLLVDAEAHWLHRGNNEQQVAYELGLLTDAILLGVTGYAGVKRMEPKYRSLVEVADYVIPQAYSNYTPKQAWTGSWGWRPGPCQKMAYKNWTSPLADVIMGLGAWHQARPGMSVEEAMGTAFQTCEDLGIEEVAYWSRKHLKRNRHGEGDFVRRKCTRLK